MTQPRPRRATRPAGPPTAGACRCTPGPVTVAVFRAEALVDVERRHWAGRDGCRMDAEHVNPTTWLATR